MHDAGSMTLTGDTRLRAVIEDGARRMGVALDESQIDRLARHCAEIELWNPRLKLVAASGIDLATRHVLDSLAGVPALSESRTIVDVGAGAGFPGIPIAIANPDATVHLVERSGRRCGFLRNALAVVPVANARVVEADVERADLSVDAVVLRAYHPLTVELVESLVRLLARSGVIVAYKGRRSTAEAEIDRLTRGGVSNIDLIPVEVPFLDEERHLVLIRPA